MVLIYYVNISDVSVTSLIKSIQLSHVKAKYLSFATINTKVDFLNKTTIL